MIFSVICYNCEWKLCAGYGSFGCHDHPTQSSESIRDSRIFFFWVSFRFRCAIAVGFRSCGIQGTLSLTRSFALSFSVSVGFGLERSSFGLPVCLFAASRNAKCSSFTEVSTWRSLRWGSGLGLASALASAFGAIPRAETSDGTSAVAEAETEAGAGAGAEEGSWHLRII